MPKNSDVGQYQWILEWIFVKAGIQSLKKLLYYGQRQISHIRNSVPYVPRKAGVFRMDTLIRMRDKKLAEQSLSGLQFWVMTLLNLYMGFRPHTSTVLEIQWLDFMMNPDGTIKMTDGVFPDTMYVNVGPEKCNKDWKRLTIHRYRNYPLFDLIPYLCQYITWLAKEGHHQGYLFPKISKAGIIDGTIHVLTDTY
eukprot:490151_1